MNRIRFSLSRYLRMIAVLSITLGLMGALLIVLNASPAAVRADTLAPPEGYPKFNTSVKRVTPTLAHSGGATLTYEIEIRNTGAYTASGTTLVDPMPEGTTYVGDAASTVSSTFAFVNDSLTWIGDVGFDDVAVISFSVTVDPLFTGTVRNAVVISHPLALRAVTKTAETVVTDVPILAVEKTSAPSVPGANQRLTYTLTVANRGQPADNLSLTVTDRVPLSTTVATVGRDGLLSGDVVTWTRAVSLDLGSTTAFTFSVDVGDVPSGTVIANSDYAVASPSTGLTQGDLYTVTVVDPILRLTKHVWPDPPGSNREMTYTLALLNRGSLATGLVITDRVPAGVEYRRGGVMTNGVVSWTLPRLETGGSAVLTYTVYVSDVMDIPIVNADYGVCSAEGICRPGWVVTSAVQGPVFAVRAALDPIAKKPGGGGGPVTPTLWLRNLGPGNAIDARALIKFIRISISTPDDLVVMPNRGTIVTGPDCGDKCVSYLWTGDLNGGEVLTMTTSLKQGTRGRSTIGGEEGTLVTATVSITDGLTTGDTAPVSGTANSKITHFAHLNATKSAPVVIGRGQVMTYSINVWNSALATEQPPYPYLWDALPISGVTVLSERISHGGQVQSVLSGVEAMDVISWTLSSFGTGERIEPRTFAVRVDNDVVSGTLLVNDPYRVFWYESDTITATGWYSNTGDPVTTTVKEVGLIHSYKTVTPALASPGEDILLTYTLHLVNSSSLTATDVTVEDWLPWEVSTYQRDARATVGEVISDIVSFEWHGEMPPLSSVPVTATVRVDADYRGPVTNTAVITSPDLLAPVEVDAVAYVTDAPMLRITKTAAKDEVEVDSQLRYTLQVINLGQEATGLLITDTLPAGTLYVPGSGGELQNADTLQWEATSLAPGATRSFGFAVTVTQQSGRSVVNDAYGVLSHEGVGAVGQPVVTPITGGALIYLPLVLR